MDIAGANQFLLQLQDNNTKVWFDQNRQEYQAIREQLKELAFNVMVALSGIDKTINFPTDIKIFRINRDIRFSHNKQPYKTNLGITIASHGKMAFNPGYYLHLSPEDSFAAAGWYSPDKTILPKIRTHISQNYLEFTKILTHKKLLKSFPHGMSDFGDSLKNAPRGFEKDDLALAFIRKKHFIVSSAFDFESSLDLQSFAIEHFAAAAPLNAFLQDAHKIQIK